MALRAPLTILRNEVTFLLVGLKGAAAGAVLVSVSMVIVIVCEASLQGR